MSEDFINKVGRILCQAWNEGRFDSFNEVYSENFVRHRQPLADINGLDNLKKYISKFRDTFPGVECSHDEIIAWLLKWKKFSEEMLSVYEYDRISLSFESVISNPYDAMLTISNFIGVNSVSEVEVSNWIDGSLVNRDAL